MAGSLTDAAEIDILKLCTKQTASIFPVANIYIALYTAAPTDSTAGTEATGGGYARVLVTGSFATPSAGSVSNNATITVGPFSGAVSSSAAIVAIGILDASSAGNLLWYSTLADQTKTYGNGDSFQITSGNLTLTAD